MQLGPVELLLILAIIMVLFGAGRVANIGGELGQAIKNFRKGLQDEESAEKEKSA